MVLRLRDCELRSLASILDTPVQASEDWSEMATKLCDILHLSIGSIDRANVVTTARTPGARLAIMRVADNIISHRTLVLQNPCNDRLAKLSWFSEEEG